MSKPTSKPQVPLAPLVPSSGHGLGTASVFRGRNATCRTSDSPVEATPSRRVTYRGAPGAVRVRANGCQVILVTRSGR